MIAIQVYFLLKLLNKMKIFFFFTPLILFFGCNIIEETNWSFLPPVKNEWESFKTFGGSKEDIANAIISTKDDGFAIIGNTKSTDGDFNFKKREGSDVFLMKFNYLSENGSSIYLDQKLTSNQDKFDYKNF